MSFANLKKSSKENFKKLLESVQKEKAGRGFDDSRFWAPDVDKSGSGIAVIRFLPLIDGADSIFPWVNVISHSFKHNGKWYIENCPKTLGEDHPCPVCESNKELWDTKIKANQDIVRSRKRKKKFISNILVISDPKHPENEGKNFLYSYGSKILGKITAVMEPEFADESPYSPFDFWDGANFKIKVKSVENFRNYDDSKFGDRGPLFENDEDIERVWRAEYDLNEFIDPKRFKPYDELYKRFMMVTSASNGVPKDILDEYTREVEEKKPTKVDTSFSKEDEDDDDFSLFKNMIDS